MPHSSSKDEPPPKNPLSPVRWPAQIERRDPALFDVFFRSPHIENRKIPGWRGKVYSRKESARLDYATSAGRRLLLELDNSPEVVRLWPFALEIPVEAPVSGKMGVLFPDLTVALYDGRWILTVTRGLPGMATREGKRTYTAVKAYAERYGFGYLMTDGSRSMEDLLTYPVSVEFRRALSQAVESEGSLARPDVERLMENSGATRQDLLAAITQEPMAYHVSSGSIDWLGGTDTVL